MFYAFATCLLRNPLSFLVFPVSSLDLIFSGKVSGANRCFCFFVLQVEVVKLKLDKDRNTILARKNRDNIKKGKGELMEQ